MWGASAALAGIGRAAAQLAVLLRAAAVEGRCGNAPSVVEEVAVPPAHQAHVPVLARRDVAHTILVVMDAEDVEDAQALKAAEDELRDILSLR